LIFVPSSPRYVSVDSAAKIVQALPHSVLSVGVFVNMPREEIERIIAQTGIRCLQLHGDETPEETAGYALPVWKAFHVAQNFDVADLSRYDVPAFVLDTFSAGAYGGTGKTFDWRIARSAKRYGNILLSGGVTPENIAEAVKTVEPYGVDVNSGVESAPGKKDYHKLNTLFTVLRTRGGDYAGE
jgi:phosphoribosylanthranilate isomerase